MAEKIITFIKPILVKELKKEIENHKTDFDQVEKGIDKVIDDIEGEIKPIAGPIVTGIKLIPFGDPKEELIKLADEVKDKIEGIGLSTELSNIEGLPEDIKSRVAALPEKVKTKLKDLMDKIITGEDKHSDSQGTEVSHSTSTEASESKTEASESASSTSTDLNTQQLFSGLATDKLKDEARNKIINELIYNEIFDSYDHIIDFVNVIKKKASSAQAIGSVMSSQPISAVQETNTNMSPPSTAQEIGSVMSTKPISAVQGIETNMLPSPPSAAQVTKTDESKTNESKTDGTNTENNNSIMPPAPPSATQATGTDGTETNGTETKEAKTEDTNTKGGAPKKQRRKTKKNIRRGRLNKSTRFGRAF